MKNLRQFFLCTGAILALMSSVASEAQQPNNAYQNPNFQQPQQAQTGFKIGIVNPKKCLDESKLGKQEQANFNKMKDQMESVLQEKAKALEEIESKLIDEDYLDSISNDAEINLKKKKNDLRKEAVALETQYLQTLQQANFKIVQKLTDVIGKASEQVAREMGFDMILNDEACTFYKNDLDVSSRIVAKMDAIYNTEAAKDTSKK